MRITLSATVVHRHGPGGCARCPARGRCTVLCSEAEALVNQDYTPQREKTIGMPDFIPEATIVPDDSYVVRYTRMEKSILTLLHRGKTKQEICEILGMNRKTLKTHIWNIRHKTLPFTLR